MRKNNKGSVMTNRQYEKEEKSREQIKEFYMTGQISSEVAAYILRLLGFSALRGKDVVKQWRSEKPDAR